MDDGADEVPGARRGGDGSRRRGAGLLALLVIGVALASVLWVAALPPTRLVRLAPDAVILRASDITDIGWGLRAAGSNGSGVWRLFSVHNELVLAFLNVTLWVDPDVATAAQRFARVADAAPYPTQDGLVANADASRFGSPGTSPYAWMVVRRYNVVFVLSAYLESSWYLTRSDLGLWSGWQLGRIEAAAA